MPSLQQAFDDVQILVKTFSNNYNHYMSPGYSEAEARQDFIDNFFIALGWDVRHNTQTNPYEQDVKIEKSQSQQNESARKRADYAFYAAPNYKDEVFFAEAKKPSVLIQHNPQHYFQTIKYGWNSGCPICVLTDFEELVIVDCRQKPDIKYALNGHHKTYRYTDYKDKEIFAEIYWLFSREAVLNNSLQKYTATMPKPKGKVVQKALFKGGYQAIDDSFLEYIDAIRENIAKAFKKNNEDLNSEQLTEATQRTVDRLVFIRFLEDKFIEAAEHVSEWKSWKDFISDCRKLDAKYNGIVFKKHFIDEPHFLGANESLFLDICSDISNLNSPYDFNYIPIHILGSIYERFLGKIVRTTDKRVFIEEKPEVRKAGGVFYTPKYIVDYIVMNTIGKIIEGLTPKQIAEKHFADIACGSGSFLIGVYDCLLDYHKKYYVEKLQGKTEIDGRSEDFGNVEFKDGQWILTLKLKQDILLNNIYGVDIDAQAVEVTQMSLFLKMLDEENLGSTTAKQGAVFSKVLPDLSKNIVCGNSLIGFDIMDGQLFEDEELKDLNPMDYETAFAAKMRNVKFDAIVENHPYVRIQTLKETTPKSVNYFAKKYKSGSSGNYDLYVLFIEKAATLLAEKGLLGYILPNKFFNTDYGLHIRNFITSEKLLSRIVDFGHFQIFKNATTYTCILFLDNQENTDFEYQKVNDSEELDSINFLTLKTEDFNSDKWNFSDTDVSDIFTKIKNDSTLLIDLPAHISRGSSTGNDKIFVLTNKDGNYVNGLNEVVQIEVGILKKPMYATDFTRYYFKPVSNYFLIFPYKITETGYSLYSERELESDFPLAYNYLLKKKKLLQERKQFQEWYGYSAPRSLKLHSEADLVIPLLADHGIFTSLPIDKKDFTLMASGGFSITFNENANPNFILGLINSKLLFWYLAKISNVFRGGWITCTKQYFAQLPIKIITEKNKTLHDQIVTLVSQMIDSKKQLATAMIDSDKNFLQNKCSSLDRQIDNLVYQLYELNAEEIKIIEGN